MTDVAGYGFPTTDCESGLNARIHFPACWDGKASRSRTRGNEHADSDFVERRIGGPVARRVPFGSRQWRLPRDAPGRAAEAPLRGKGHP